MTKPLGALIRVSTSAQDPASQRNRIETWRGAREVSWYVEDDTSGKLSIRDRPELARLFADLRSGTLAGIVVTEQSRIGRDAWATLARVGECRELGVEVWILDMDAQAALDLDDPLVFLRLAAGGFTSAMERLGIGRRTKAALAGPRGPRGRQTAVRSGREVGRPGWVWTSASDAAVREGLAAGLTAEQIAERGLIMARRRGIGDDGLPLVDEQGNVRRQGARAVRWEDEAARVTASAIRRRVRSWG